jgi:hypothetical protein
MSELLRIDIDNGVLITPTKEYRVSQSISMDRMMKFEELQCGVAYGHTFIEVHDRLAQLKGHLQKANFVDAAVVLNNLMEALHPDNASAKKRHYVLQICALFLNSADEDVKEWREDIIDAKIDDWLKAGVDYRDFFVLAVSLVPDLLTVLNETFQTISQMEQAIGEKKNIQETK